MHRLFRRERIPHGASDPRKGASPETRFHPGKTLCGQATGVWTGHDARNAYRGRPSLSGDALTCNVCWARMAVSPVFPAPKHPRTAPDAPTGRWLDRWLDGTCNSLPCIDGAVLNGANSCCSQRCVTAEVVMHGWHVKSRVWLAASGLASSISPKRTKYLRPTSQSQTQANNNNKSTTLKELHRQGNETDGPAYSRYDPGRPCRRHAARPHANTNALCSSAAVLQRPIARFRAPMPHPGRTPGHILGRPISNHQGLVPGIIDGS